MIVRLPKEVSGEELLKIITEAAKEISEEGYRVSSLGEKNRYEPGSVKEVLHNFQVIIRQHRQDCSNNRFIRFFQNVSFFPSMTLRFPEILTGVNYGEIDIETLTWYTSGYLEKLRLSDKDKAVLEKLVGAIYKKIDPTLSMA